MPLGLCVCLNRSAMAGLSPTTLVASERLRCCEIDLVGPNSTLTIEFARPTLKHELRGFPIGHWPLNRMHHNEGENDLRGDDRRHLCGAISYTSAPPMRLVCIQLPAR